MPPMAPIHPTRDPVSMRRLHIRQTIASPNPYDSARLLINTGTNRRKMLTRDWCRDELLVCIPQLVGVDRFYLIPMNRYLDVAVANDPTDLCIINAGFAVIGVGVHAHLWRLPLSGCGSGSEYVGAC